MNPKSTIFALCLIGCGLSLPLAAKAEPPILAQPDTQPEIPENSQSLPWEFFNSTAGDYVVDLPGTPVEQSSTSSLLEHDLRWQMDSVTLPVVDEADLFEYYLVAYVDIPRGLRYENSQQELLDAAISTVVNDIEDEQLSSTLEIEPIAFRGVPARLLTGQGLGQSVVMTLSITGDRLYLLLAIDDDLANFEHFFNSFSFVPG
jgi:hypothetical protein